MTAKELLQTLQTDNQNLWATVHELQAENRNMQTTIATLQKDLDAKSIESEELLAALKGIIEIGKRDMSNPKYDGYFEAAKEAIAKCSK